jgi:hypothetical protein
MQGGFLSHRLGLKGMFNRGIGQLVKMRKPANPPWVILSDFNENW